MVSERHWNIGQRKKSHTHSSVPGWSPAGNIRSVTHSHAGSKELPDDSQFIEGKQLWEGNHR